MEFHFGKVVTEISHPKLVAGGEEWTAEQILVCSGADFEALYPSLYAASGITKVKLQMMRTAPQPRNWRLGPSLCAGLTLTHYTALSGAGMTLSFGVAEEIINNIATLMPSKTR